MAMLSMFIGMLIGHSLTESAHGERSRQQAEEQNRINAAWEALKTERRVAGSFWDQGHRLRHTAHRAPEWQMLTYIWEVSVTADEDEDEDND